ncbi:fibronectin type III domain-containing protein [Prosthecobacter sp.]|uniref:fibronectin type III domain-containing protein n=1 Tax=Prosthecobacter sp. TaxID=1965333 RepID=UPI001DDC9C28|nr:fibronectin type III domain-containing protein [Prosthecobacter sp.]MCB1278973.1 fibronectin type III domain-containing protein [Prosthecobacter sp.]
MRTFVHQFICVLACLGGTLLHAVELVGQPKATTTANTATVQWRTDVDCGTRLQFGRNPDTLDQKAEGVVTSDHKIVLESLAPGTTYHFSVGSARTRLATGTFTTAGGSGAASPQPSLMRRVLDVFTPESKAEAKVVSAKTPPTQQTWAHPDSLRDHFERHGRDFSSKTPDDYAAQAWQFLQRARTENLPMKLDDTDGTLRVFDPNTRAFAAYDGSGRTKTFFKPESPTYWQRQPGRTVRSSELRLRSR